MADSEKLAALKKAYAEIILNTAKEGAARMMVSERKAERYRQELAAAKDEALRMLIRLKIMLDSKESESEMAAMTQTKKIEELEAQLGEAEDIVKDLRSELSELQDELDNVKNHEKRPPAEEISETLFSHQPHDDRWSQGSAMFLQPVVPYKPINLEAKNSVASGMPIDERCSNQNSVLGEKLFPCDSDFSLIRRKEPELYRNGCTHRVRASEMSVCGGSLALSGGGITFKNQIGSADRDANASTKLFGATIVYDAREIVAEAKEVGTDVRNTKAHNLTGSGKASCKKRNIDVSSDKVSPDMVVVHCNETLEKLTLDEERSQGGSEYFLAKELLSNPGTGSLDVNNRRSEFLRACVDQSKANKGNLKDNIESNGQYLESALKSGLADGREDLQMAYVLNLDSKESDTTESPSEPCNDWIPRYTFHRKRKREFPSSLSTDSSSKNGSLNGHLNQQRCDPNLSRKPDLITESFYDEVSCKQVDYQLKLLSESKPQ